jgi:predicted dehydrogenase
MSIRKATGVLVVGCGSIGQRHIRCFLKTERVKVCACDQDHAKLDEAMKAYGISGFQDLDQALAQPEINAVVIATPAPTHIRIAIKAAQAGKHLLIEKPLALDCAGISELLKIARSHSLVTAVAYVYRFRTVFSRMKKFLEASKLGDPVLAILKGGQPFDEKRPGYEKTYFASHESGGGAIQDGLCHYSDLLSWFIGRCDRMTAHATHALLPNVTVEDTVTMLGLYGRTSACIHMNLFQAPTEFTMEIHCQNGSVKAELHNSRWGYFNKGDSDWTWETVYFVSADEPFTAQASAFLNKIEGKSSQLANLQDGVEQIQVVQAALDIASKGSALQSLNYPQLDTENEPD